MKNAKALKILEKGMSNRDVAAKYGVPKNTLSSWVKNKEKLLDSTEKGNNIKRQNLRTGNFEMVEKAVYNWFLSMRSQNVPLSAVMIQEKTLTFAKESIVETFQASDGWLQRCKEGNQITSKTVSRKSKSVTPEMLDG